MKRLSFLLAFILVVNYLPAQWIPQLSGTNNFLNEVFFLNDSVGWVVGESGILLQTSDGGNEWEIHQLDLNEDYYDIYFHDSSNGWMVGTRYNETNKGKVFHTADGGSSWQTQLSIDSSNLYDLSFVDSLNGWVLGQKHGGNYVLLKTADGGNSWEYKDTDSLIGLQFKFQFVDILNGWVVGDHGDNLWGVIYHSSDGGESWETQDYFDYDFTDLHFIDEFSGWISGKDDEVPTQGGVILRTDDGGISWQETTTDYGLRGVHFSDEYNGWAISGYGYVYNTTDGGINLELQYNNNTFLKNVFFSDNQNGWIVGGGGTILYTTNGGTVSVENFEISRLNDKVTCFPVPFTTSTTIEYTLDEPTEVSLSIYNHFGEQVKYFQQHQLSGIQHVIWNSEGLPPGIYFFTLSADEQVATGKMIKMR